LGVEVKVAAEEEVVIDEGGAPIKKVEEKPTVLYANDCTLNEMIMVVIGT